MTPFELNGKKVTVDTPVDTPLLWVLREELEMTGTKFGCGKGLCGACTIHLNGQAVRSCVLPLVAVANQKVTTIEGLAGSHPVQAAWIKNNVPQCGYCQSGQIMQTVSFIENSEHVDQDKLIENLSGNICRCGTYNRIKKAAIEAAKTMGKA